MFDSHYTTKEIMIIARAFTFGYVRTGGDALHRWFIGRRSTQMGDLPSVMNVFTAGST